LKKEKKKVSNDIKIQDGSWICSNLVWFCPYLVWIFLDMNRISQDQPTCLLLPPLLRSSLSMLLFYEILLLLYCLFLFHVVVVLRGFLFHAPLLSPLRQLLYSDCCSFIMGVSSTQHGHNTPSHGGGFQCVRSTPMWGGVVPILCTWSTNSIFLGAFSLGIWELLRNLPKVVLHSLH